MDTISLYDAKANLSQLLDRAVAGEDIVIAKPGQPPVRLVPVQVRKGPRRLGVLEGQVRIGDDFDEPLPEEIARAFRGEGP